MRLLTPLLESSFGHFRKRFTGKTSPPVVSCNQKQVLPTKMNHAYKVKMVSTAEICVCVGALQDRPGGYHADSKVTENVLGPDLWNAAQVSSPVQHCEDSAWVGGGGRGRVLHHATWWQV